MGENLKIIKIEKYNEQIDKHINSSINNTKLLALYGILLFSSEKGLFENDTEELIVAGCTLFGTLSLISLVKSICKIYQLNEKKRQIEDADKQK